MNTRKLTVLSLSVALAMVFSFIETLIPPIVAVPGVKLGLANVVSVFLLYSVGRREAFTVAVIRVCLSSLLFGSAVSLVYSLSGALLSLGAMMLLMKLPIFSLLSVSVVGGVLHNAAQIICACIIMENAAIASYLPVLIISGTVAGIFVGLLAVLLTSKLSGKINI